MERSKRTPKKPATKKAPKSLKVYVIQNGHQPRHIGNASTKTAARSLAKKKGFAVYPEWPVEKYDEHIFGGETGREVWSVLVTGKLSGHSGGFSSEKAAKNLAATITAQGRKASVHREGSQWFVKTANETLGRGGKVVG